MFKRKKPVLDLDVAPSMLSDTWRRLHKNKAAMFGLAVIIIITLMAIFADVIADYPSIININPIERLQLPSSNHFLGTDTAGRDMLGRIAHGARYSLAFGIICTFFSILLGAAFGATAAYFGGKVDTAITFLADSIICIPGMMLSLSLVAMLGVGFTNLIIAITISYTPSFVRVIRSIVLGIVNQEYIEAARAIGVSPMRIIFRHILPNAIGLIVINATMNISGLILQAASLSFIGMGIQPPAPEWGAMLSDSLTYFRTYPHIVLIPGFFILILSLSFNLLGDGLSEALDPRMKD